MNDFNRARMPRGKAGLPARWLARLSSLVSIGFILARMATDRPNPFQPFQVQRSRPKARLRVEMPASIPARKLRRVL